MVKSGSGSGVDMNKKVTLSNIQRKLVYGGKSILGRGKKKWQNFETGACPMC